MAKIVVQVDADLEDLIPDYLENRQNDVKALEQALEAKDFETIRILGHTMKGTGGGYGFERITEIGRALEEGAKSMDAAGILKGLNQLQEYLKAVEVVYR